MPEFRITFGQKYRRELHPTFGGAHPDGWLTIMADDEDAARATAVGWLGTKYSSLANAAAYDDWDAYFPLGELHRIEAPR